VHPYEQCSDVLLAPACPGIQPADHDSWAADVLDLHSCSSDAGLVGRVEPLCHDPSKLLLGARPQHGLAAAMTCSGVCQLSPMSASEARRSRRLE